MKKLLVSAIICLILPMRAQAACDTSAQNVRRIAQAAIDRNYSYNSLGMKKPRLVISPKKTRGYDGEELNGTITIYPAAIRNIRCDGSFDGLTPYVTKITNHEYTHAIDEKLRLSKRIGEKPMSENTAFIGEHVFKNLLWRSSFTTVPMNPAYRTKYETLLAAIRISS